MLFLTSWTRITSFVLFPTFIQIQLVYMRVRVSGIRQNDLIYLYGEMIAARNLSASISYRYKKQKNIFSLFDEHSQDLLSYNDGLVCRTAVLTAVLMLGITSLAPTF